MKTEYDDAIFIAPSVQGEFGKRRPWARKLLHTSALPAVQ